MSLLNEFRAFTETLEEPFADFEEADSPGIVKEIFGDRAGEFEVFGMHGSGSRLAVWNIDGKQPVIWADTQWEAGVVAASVEEFLCLLPYDTGFLYDLAVSGREIGPEEAAEQLTQAAEENPDQPKLIAWLESKGLKVPTDPAAVIAAARAGVPDIKALIQ